MKPIDFLGKIEEPDPVNPDDFDFNDPDQANAFMEQWRKIGLANLKRELKAQYEAGIIDKDGKRIKKD